ncbi:MAG: thrombospondin type 3 repeat-containing protein [Stagnimonas sp.]|nr:thrombospondin type 3 repeat-containing protein [Stagnimonas sp.]
MKLFTRIIAAAASAVAALSFSVSAAQAAETDYRWYVSPSVGAIFSGTGAGPAASLSVGRTLLPNFGFEIEGAYANQDLSDLPSGNSYKRLTFGVSGLGYFLPESQTFRPYGIANINVHQIDFLGESLSGGGLGFGAGAMVRVNQALDFRLEARYNLDFISKTGVVEKSTFNTGGLTAGFRYKFGADPDDEDGDGVPNSRDKCPGTPKGVTVYSDGCPTDLDGDGVPDYLDKCPNTPKGTVVNKDGCPADSDGDGILDVNDKCPGTPRGIAVGPDGCPLDSDGDGIPDYLDKCPATPAGTKVDERGCPFTDADGDGIPDYLDKCPNSPKGIAVGPDGCPLDSDGDGIPDYLDECPNTPPGLKVLPNGCALVGDCRKPRPGEAVDKNGCAIDKRFILRGVKFEFDSDRLTKPSEKILADVGETLKSYPTVKVDVEGHTDDIGSDAYNQGLSERRANVVKKFLVDVGAVGANLKPVGFGESVPIDTNATEPGRDNNRRVEFKVTN